MSKLITYATDLARKDGSGKIYVSIDQEGIYEKYMFEFLEVMKDKCGGNARVYVRDI